VAIAGMEDDCPDEPALTAEGSGALVQVTVTADKFTSPTKVDRFAFVSATQVPLPLLEEQSTKRRHEYNTRIFELDCKVASLQSQLMNEHMDLEFALSDHLARHTYQPLERCMERMRSRLMLEDLQLKSVMSRLAALQITHAKHIHIDLADARRDQRDVADMTHQLLHTIQLECHKADKREGALMQRFERMAGTAARRYYEESSARKAALVYLQSLLDNQGEMDQQRAMEFLKTIKQLRERLSEERKVRKFDDGAVLQAIEARTAELRRALLETAGRFDA